MSKTKIVMVGAASTIFGVNTLSDLIAQREHLQGSHLALCDIDPTRLARMTRLAERLNDATRAGYRISSSTNLRELLPGAEFVVVSAELDRIARWKKDWEIPFKYSIKHVLGENGGPGGLAHSLRTIDLTLGIAEQIEQVAPDAYLINFTNPLSRVCMALNRYTNLNVIGLCHQINKGYYVVGHVLGHVPRLEEHFPPPHIADGLMGKFELQTVGLNHLTWIQSIRDRATGADLYPEFSNRLEHFDPTFEPLSRRLYRTFGLYPASGDDHVGEYFSFAHETSDLKGYDFGAYAERARELERRVSDAAGPSTTMTQFLNWESGERGAHVIAAIANNSRSYESVVNVPNGGALPGLPDWSIVEVPAVLGSNGAMPVSVPSLPPVITAVLNQQVAVQDRVVEAAVHGDRQAALQALLLDPVVPSYADAERMLDELLSAHADLLPRFREQS